MSTFKDFEYKRPNLDEMKEQFAVLLEDFKAAKSVEAQSEVIEQLNKLRNTFSTMANIVYIRASIDTNDEFYQQERDHFDEVSPIAEELVFNSYTELVKSPFRAKKKEKWGFKKTNC